MLTKRLFKKALKVLMLTIALTTMSRLMTNNGLMTKSGLMTNSGLLIQQRRIALQTPHNLAFL